MVKIVDPRKDSSGMRLRSLRAEKCYGKISKMISKNKKIDQDKLKLWELDPEFNDEFDKCSDAIKSELVFLWEEIGHLEKELKQVREHNNELIKYYNTEYNENTNEKLPTNFENNVLDEVEQNNTNERLYIFGP